MAITATFYKNVGKKLNSTKIPTYGYYDEIDLTVELKAVTNLFTPSLVISADTFTDNQGNIVNPMQYNYCYLPDFQRYYFVNDWTFSGRHWIASLSIDVLGTYKSQIGASSLYVLRSASHSNGRVTDNKYPVIAKPYTYIDDIGTVYEMYQGTLDPSPQPYQRLPSICTPSWALNPSAAPRSPGAPAMTRSPP